MVVLAGLLAACGSSEAGSRDAPTTWQIAFERGREIWTVMSDGTGLRRLAAARGGLFGGMGLAMSWSPDGARIAFVDRAGGRAWEEAQLAVVDADGTNRRPGGPVGPVFEPAWSPDSRTIAFTKQRLDARARPLMRATPGSSPPRGALRGASHLRRSTVASTSAPTRVLGSRPESASAYASSPPPITSGPLVDTGFDS
ncbi:MAG TPA: hypothetical protein PKD59_10865 [Miltoncostaeaceae bacterium]|nr:hypothetical protein [Miltoncostaeaceae bacterium]